MGVAEWTQLAGAALSGSALPWLAAFVRRRLFTDPKAEAEARKLNTEADGLIVTRLYAEIERLDRDLSDLRTELLMVKRSAEDEKTHLETENKRLRMEVSSLRTRVGQLEEIIKTRTTPEDMLAQLAEIDRKTAKRSRR